MTLNPVGKIAEKAVVALYFECRINKKRSFRLFFGDFAPWEDLNHWYSNPSCLVLSNMVSNEKDTPVTNEKKEP